MDKYLTASPLTSSFLLPSFLNFSAFLHPLTPDLRLAPSYIPSVPGLPGLSSAIAHVSSWREYNVDFGQEGYGGVAHTVPSEFPGRFQLLGILRVLHHLLLLSHLPPLRLLLHSKILGMPCSLDTPLSPTEQDDHTGIIPFEEFEDIPNDIDEFDASSVWDALLAAAPLPESVEAAQSSNENDLSNRNPPESDSQGTHQILTSKSVSIPIAASGSSEAIDDSNVNNGGDDGDGSDGGKIKAVLQVPVAELAEKRKPTQA